MLCAEGSFEHMSGFPQPGRRICVIGTSGSGKTFVARTLAERLRVPYISNDAIIWRPGWQPTPPAERLVQFEAATRPDGWTFDGNLGSREEDKLVLKRCDTLVWLDPPRWLVHWRVTQRSVLRVLTREPLWHGNVETWRRLFSRDSIVWWSVKTHGRRREEYWRLFHDPEYSDRRRIRLRSRGEIAEWLGSVRCP